MKRVLSALALVLVLCYGGLYAQNPEGKVDIATITTSTSTYTLATLPSNIDPLGLYIWNMDDVDTLYLNLQNQTPTSSNAVRIPPNNDFYFGYAVRSFKLKAKTGSCVVQIIRSYRKGR